MNIIFHCSILLSLKISSCILALIKYWVLWTWCLYFQILTYLRRAINMIKWILMYMMCCRKYLRVEIRSVGVHHHFMTLHFRFYFLKRREFILILIAIIYLSQISWKYALLINLTISFLNLLCHEVPEIIIWRVQVLRKSSRITSMKRLMSRASLGLEKFRSE